MRSFTPFCCLVLSLAAATTHSQAPNAPAKSHTASPAAHPTPAGALTPSSLNTDNLNYGDDIKRIYLGDFDHVSFQRDSTNFSLMVSSYMTEYSKSCERYLPKDKVQIMKTVCATQVVSTNQYGQEVDARRCTQYDTVGTGRYADPRVYSLQKTLDNGQSTAVLKAYLQDITQSSGGGPGLRQMTDIGTYVLQDSTQFFVDNPCSAPATMRYQENMLRFGRNEPAIRITGAAEAPNPSPLSKQQNYKAFVNDLVTEESKAWAMNRYQPGSANVTAVQLNPDGSPKEIDAKYSATALSSSSPGKLRVTFEEDQPPCLYFSDQPNDCRIPNPKLLAAFRHNKYADPNAPTYPAIPPWDDPPGAVEARAHAFDQVQARVAAANARAAAGTAPPRPTNPRASAASAASAVRQTGPATANTPFRLTVHLVDPISETTAASSSEFRATVVRAEGLSAAQAPPGATAYLKVTLQPQSPGTRATNDVYTLLLDKLEVDGQTIPLQSKPTSIIRRPTVAIIAGTAVDFYGTQP